MSIKSSISRIRGYDPTELPLIITLIFLGLFGLSIGSLFIGSFFFRIGTTDPLSVSLIVEVVTKPGFGDLVLNTLVVGIGGGFIGTTMGAIYAWVLVRTDTPGLKVFKVLAVLPLSMPFIVKGIGWVSVFDPSIGLLSEFTERFLGITITYNIYTLEGITIALGVGGLPLAFLIIEPAVQSISSSLEEASRNSGRGMIQTVFRITLPMLLPALFSSFFLLTILNMGNFDYPFLLGAWKGNIGTLATEIYLEVYGSSTPGYPTAIVLSMVYILLAFGAMAVYLYYTKSSFRFETVTGRTERHTVHRLGRWKYGGTLLCFLLWLVSFGVPFFGMMGMAFSPGLGQTFTGFTLENFEQFLAIKGLRDVIMNTVIISVAASAGVSVFSIFIAYLSLKTDYKFRKIGDYTAIVPLGFPPIVYGLAVFWMVLMVPGLENTYGTLIPLVLALIFVRLPHGVRIMSSSLIQIADQLEEASQVSGHSWFSTFKNITVPLLKDGILNTFIYTFIDSMRELGAIVLLITAGNEVFTNLILQMYINAPSSLPIVAAGSSLFFLLILVFVIIYIFTGDVIESGRSA